MWVTLETPSLGSDSASVCVSHIIGGSVRRSHCDRSAKMGFGGVWDSEATSVDVDSVAAVMY